MRLEHRRNLDRRKRLGEKIALICIAAIGTEKFQLRGSFHTLGNRTHAATILGISIRALRNKLRDYAQSGVAVPPPAAGVAA